VSMPLPFLRAEDVKARADMVAIAGRYTHLHRAGRQFVGLCPFHRERKPSFYVHPEKKIFYCFGCRRGGDVYSFIMLAEAVDFLDALRIVSRDSDGVALASGPRSGPRFGVGEGAKPLGPPKAGTSNSQSLEGSRACILGVRPRIHLQFY